MTPQELKQGTCHKCRFSDLLNQTFGGRDQQAGDWWEAETVRMVNPQIVDVKVTTLMSL